MRRILVKTLAAALGVIPVGLFAFPPAQASDPLVNVAPNAIITTSIDGPTDSASHRIEARWSGNITRTSNWSRYFKQISRDITVDTVYDRAVSSISITLEQNPSAGVYYPQNVEFEVNQNGNWYLLGTVSTQIPVSDPSQSTQTFSVDCHDIYAHEFRIHFSVSKWVFANNLQVLADNFAIPTPGSTSTLPPVQSLSNAPLHVFDAGAHGIRDMLLVYTGSHGSLGTWQDQDFAPMLTYITQQGGVGGRMFDTMLFLPYGNLKDTQQAWSVYLSQLFNQGTNLFALNDSVATANQALSKLSTGQPPFKENVVIGLPYPRLGDGNWGTINGQQVSFDATPSDPGAVSARLQALQWYTNTLISEWNATHLSNLNLVGFYWLSEQANYSIPGEAALITGSSSMIHAAGYPLFWIPTYDAWGLDEWKQLGFDAAWLQSNYVEMGVHAPVQRLANSAQLANDYGLGVEIEIPSGVLQSQTERNLVARSVRTFQAYGLGQNVSHAYYAGSKLLVQAAQAKNAALRAIYDEVYGMLNH